MKVKVSVPQGLRTMLLGSKFGIHRPPVVDRVAGARHARRDARLRQDRIAEAGDRHGGARRRERAQCGGGDEGRSEGWAHPASMMTHQAAGYNAASARNHRSRST